MSEDTTETTGDTTTESTGDEGDQRIPLERFNQVNNKAKEAAKRADDLQKQLDEIKAQMEERESAGLPELERERKRAEQLERRAAEAEPKAAETEQKLLKTARKQLVTAAAAKAGFDDPDDATRYPEIVNLDDIEDADQAERAVKRLAKAKPRLLKESEPQLPGRVLADGRTTTTTNEGSNIDLTDEAEMLAASLKAFKERRAA